MASFNDMSASLLAGANATAPLQKVVESLGNVPGFGSLQGFISHWIKLDITAIAAALTILGTLSGVFQFLHAVIVKIYWYIVRFFTASVSINARDKLNREVLNWVGAEVLAQRGARIVTARSEEIQSDAFHFHRHSKPQTEPFDYDGKRKPIQYLPTFGSTWFYHNGNIFIVHRIPESASGMMGTVPDEFASAPEGTEPLVVMCLGRSVEPIKKFLNTCQEFADEQRKSYITIRVSKSQFNDATWDTTVLRPIRPIETIYLDEETKAWLLNDIESYLHPTTRKFYMERGIPYRKGYLLHGPAGTGKTSLSLALAGFFRLELYLLHLPSIPGDTELQRLFTALPPRCFILLEDIDAVGIKNRFRHRSGPGQSLGDNEGADANDKGDSSQLGVRSTITLSGLLNVLDGVASQEGRIVLMTSNFPERLDHALHRPGRIDKEISLGNISQKAAELMFMRMYGEDPAPHPSFSSAQRAGAVAKQEVLKLSQQFSNRIKPGMFTPAKLQGYLLEHRNKPIAAVEGLETWMSKEIASMGDEKKRAQVIS